MTDDLDPTSRRVVVGIPIALAMLAMLGPFSIDTPFPAFAQMRGEFGVDASATQLVVTVYMLAFASTSMFHGPLSDSLGRRPVIVWSLGVYAVASLACTLAPSLEWLLIGRAVQGMAAGGSMIVSRTIIRDLFDGARAQRLMSRVAVIFGIAPALAPILGGVILQLGPWRLVFGFLGLLGVLLIAVTVLVLPESHPPERRTPLRLGDVLAGLLAVLRLGSFHRVAWAATLVFGAQFLYIGGAAIFVGDVLGLGELDYWQLFVPMIGAMMIGSSVSGRMADVLGSRELVSIGCGIALAGGLLGVAVALTPWGDAMPWAILGVSLIALGNGLCYPNFQLLVLDLLPARRGAVMSAMSFVTLVFNAVVAVAVTPLIGASVLGFALTALACVVVGVGCWVWHRATERRLDRSSYAG